MIKFIFLIIISINALYAKIDATVDKNHIEEGEVVTYSINIIADNVKKNKSTNTVRYKYFI